MKWYKKENYLSTPFTTQHNSTRGRWRLTTPCHIHNSTAGLGDKCTKHPSIFFFFDFLISSLLAEQKVSHKKMETRTNRTQKYDIQRLYGSQSLSFANNNVDNKWNIYEIELERRRGWAIHVITAPYSNNNSFVYLQYRGVQIIWRIYKKYIFYLCT